MVKVVWCILSECLVNSVYEDKEEAEREFKSLLGKAGPDSFWLEQSQLICKEE
jgi:hypothetical protein